jgi:hypothetical protein
MNISWTLFRYLAKQFLLSVGIVFFFCLTLAFIISLVDLLTRVSGKDHVPLDAILAMAALKLPNLTEKMMPFGARRLISSTEIEGETSRLNTPLSRTRRAISCAVWLPKSRMRTVSVPGGGVSTMVRGQNVAPLVLTRPRGIHQ